MHWYRLEGHIPVRVDDEAEQIAEWQRRYEQRSVDPAADPYRVARTELPGGIVVSTVFLAIDHQVHPGGPPLLFETMVFTKDDGGQEPFRTPNWDAALAMHDRIVAAVRATLDG